MDVLDSSDAARSSRKKTIKVLDRDIIANMTSSDGALDWRWVLKEIAMYSKERRQADGNSLSGVSGEYHHSM